MKFEKFLKMMGGRGVVVDRGNGEKWVLFNGVMLRVPDGTNVIEAFTMGDKPFINHVFNEYADENISTAELTGAILPEPDASASKVIRVFSDADGGKIGITNKAFSLIEKSDEVVTAYDQEYNDENPVALVILNGYDTSEEIAGIIFNDDYFAAKIHEKE